MWAASYVGKAVPPTEFLANAQSSNLLQLPRIAMDAAYGMGLSAGSLQPEHKHMGQSHREFVPKRNARAAAFSGCAQPSRLKLLNA